MAALKIQVTFDCSDPHEVADWWANALDWNVEPQDAEFIKSMIAQGFAQESDTVTHNGKLVWRTGCAINSPDINSPRIYFQEVPEPKTIKNRVHLDLRHGDANLEELRAKLESLGAVFQGTGQQGPHSWTTYQDPWGNEFCV